MYFGDESSFNTVPSVPYSWQEKNCSTTIDSFKGPSLNVIGFMAPDNRFQSFVFNESISTNAVVGCIDKFVKTIKRKTILILDNAPTHSSDDFAEKIPDWKKLGLEIKFLPAYSPELNKIEILWRFIKYQWLSFSSYKCFNSLKENLFHILKNFGKLYKINFTY